MSKRKIPKVSSNPLRVLREPVIASQTSIIKVPKIAEPIVSSDHLRKVRFMFDVVDHDGPWSLVSITPDDHHVLIKFMAHIEQMTAGELFKPGQRMCKTYSDMSLCPTSAVLTRLAELFDGLDNMVRLELDGLRRLYGIRTGHEFHIVWWDPHHEIWPAKLKHT